MNVGRRLAEGRGSDVGEGAGMGQGGLGSDGLSGSIVGRGRDAPEITRDLQGYADVPQVQRESDRCGVNDVRRGGAVACDGFEAQGRQMGEGAARRQEPAVEVDLDRRELMEERARRLERGGKQRHHPQNPLAPTSLPVFLVLGSHGLTIAG